MKGPVSAGQGRGLRPQERDPVCHSHRISNVMSGLRLSTERGDSQDVRKSPLWGGHTIMATRQINYFHSREAHRLCKSESRGHLCH